MGVYVIGMKTPSCCMFCPVSNSVGCGLANPPIIMTSKEMLAGRPDWCPLVPVPSHGDLIDRGKLREKEFIHDGDAYAVVMSRDVRNAPTIIPAEEGKT